MSFKHKQLIGLLVLALLSVAVYQGFYQDKRDAGYEPFTKGYALTDVVMRSTDDSGQVVTRLQSPNMTHYLDNEQTWIKQPKVQLYTEDTTWDLQAPEAIYQRNEQSLYFPETVTVASKQAPKITIASSQLRIDLISREGSTPAEISMVQDTGFMQGVGAHILFTSKQIEILKNVYAEFKPR